MRISRVAILPSLCTLGNALCGFAAMVYTWKALVDSIDDVALPLSPPDVKWAGYLVLLGMVFDALDGRLARIGRATSDFGGQLDSLADAITFGVAPAFLMNRVVVESLRRTLADRLWGMVGVTWVCAAVYLACALIRLARFNVENIHEEEAHKSFRGLPSPGAAGALVSLVIVVAACWQNVARQQLGVILLWLLPVAAVVLGILMVSNVRYSHILNYALRGRRPISYLVQMVFGAALAILIIRFVGHEIGLVLGFGGYAISGPTVGVLRRLRRRGRAAEAERPVVEPAKDASSNPP
jgi:CDP-diacylglycerol--serine O-phosphatidyltransferase